MTSIIKVDTIQDTSGNNIINENSNTITIGASGDTITIPSGATITNSGTATGFGGTTAPYCGAYRNGDQNISDATWTKIQFNTEFVDSANAFDSSTNYRFTPQTSGHYFVALNVGIGNTADNSIDDVRCRVYKNGAEITGVQARRDWDANAEGLNYVDQINTSTMVQLNGSSDYIEGFVYVNVTSGTPRVESGQTSIHIFKMTE